MAEPMTGQQMTDRPAAGLEIRRNPVLVAVVGGLAALVALAYLWRAIDTGALIAGLAAAGIGVVALGFLTLLIDSRAPLLVLDDDGARIRLRGGWRMLTWASIESATVAPRAYRLGDGRLTVRSVEGQAYAVPLGLITGVDTATEASIARTVERLAAGRTDVVTVTLRESGGRPRAVSGVSAGVSAAVGSGLSAVTTRLAQAGQAGTQRIAALTRPTGNAHVTAGSTALAPETTQRRAPLPEERLLRRPADDLDLDDEPVVILNAVEPATSSAAEAPTLGTQPVGSIGAVLRTAREHVGLSVDALAERTRIRPHIIAGIESDDFSACGGDVYARGHLRTLAFTLGIEPRSLIARFDEEHAGAEISARRVFEAELAGGSTGGLRGSTGGSGWFLLMAAVLALVLVWALMRMFVGTPNQIEQNPPVLPSDQAKAGAVYQEPKARTRRAAGDTSACCGEWGNSRTSDRFRR